MKPLVYLSGPYTKPDPVENTHNMIRIADDLLASGVIVPIIPHLTMFWHVVTPKPWEQWIEYDKEVVAHCDALFRLWGESAGAEIETAHAASLGIPCFHDRDRLVGWAVEKVVADNLEDG